MFMFTLEEFYLFMRGYKDDISRGECYQEGIYVEKDLDAALYYFHQAAKEGNIDAYPKIGKIYELKKDVDKALETYLTGALKSDRLSKESLKKFAESGNADAQYYFGILCEHEKAWENALIWYKIAADRGYQLATTKLQAIAKLDYEFAYTIAQAYENDPELENAIEIAIKYYFIAGKQKNPQALLSLEKLLEDSNNGQLLYDLAEIYQQNNETKQAIKWYMHAIQRNFKPASSQLHHIASHDPNFAFAVGQTYEKGDNGIKSIKTAYMYYAVAALQDHLESKNQLESAANGGSPNAQYGLGHGYYHRKNNISKAVYWCLQAAEQGHTQARAYLTQTTFSIAIYLEIANRYEQGDGVRANIPQAIEFYTKAYDLGSSKAAYCLGNIYLSDHPDVKKDKIKAFEYFSQAAKKGHKDAFIILEQLGQELNTEQQFQLAALYRSMHYCAQASFWQKQAEEASVPIIPIADSTFEKSTLQLTYH